MSNENRKDWVSVYAGQDEILKTLFDTKDIFLAGGTAVQRFVIKNRYRESDDLDFFLPKYDKDLARLAEVDIVSKLRDNQNIDIENIVDDKELGVYRIFCAINNNPELIKVELLDFTIGRFEDKSFLDNKLFPKIENSYNLILYKLKALCDRTDTIKDLFDLYFLFREYTCKPIPIHQLMLDLEVKFKISTGYIYSFNEVLKALNYKKRVWDIVITNDKNIPLHYIQDAIEEFRKEFLNILEGDSKTIDLSYETRAKNFIDDSLNLDEYYEYIETNLFVSKHALSLRKNTL